MPFFGADKEDFNGYLTDEEYKKEIESMRCKEDEKRKAKVFEEFINYHFNKFMENPEVRKEIALCCISGKTFRTDEEIRKYFKTLGMIG